MNDHLICKAISKEFYQKEPHDYYCWIYKLQKWLRNKHNIFVIIHIDMTCEPKYCYQVFSYKDFGNWENKLDVQYSDLYYTDKEALEEGLIRGLDFI